MAVQIIKSLAVASFDSIIKFIPGIDNQIELEVVAWQDVNIQPASATYSSISKSSPAGKYFTTQLSARLKNPISPSVVGIWKIELCSGEILILGTPDVPVKFDESYNLNIGRLNITHDSIMPPNKLIFA